MLILVLAAVLRLHGLDEHGLFFDEKVTVLVSQGIAPGGANLKEVLNNPYFTPQQVWREKYLSDYFEAMARGDWGNSAAHYLLLNCWIKLFGLSDFSVRGLSVLFSVLLSFLMFRFVKVHFKKTNLALLIAALSAIEPFFVSQSHIVRNYSMSLFLTMLATHYFLLCLKHPLRRTHYLIYSLAVTASLFSHYLTFMVFVGHGLYVLLAERRLYVWFNMAGCMILPALSLWIWMTWGGGQYSLKTVRDVETFYQQIAKNPPKPNPYAGWIDPATPHLVLEKSLKAIADYFTISNGLNGELLGYRNLLLCLAIALMSVLVYFKVRRMREKRHYLWLLLLIALSYALYSVSALAFGVLSATLILLMLTIEGLFRKGYSREWKLVVLLCLLPLIWMVFQAFKSGHTVGINLRYLAFGIPYAVMLVGFVLYQVTDHQNLFGLVLGLMLVPQLIFIAQTLDKIYDDQAPQYAFFNPPRKPNPFVLAAQRIEQLYQPGDTIIYPSNSKSVFSQADSSATKVSVFDALMVNLYLPKEAKFLQKINPNEPDRIILWQKSTQKPKVIFNFEGLKYRY